MTGTLRTSALASFVIFARVAQAMLSALALGVVAVGFMLPGVPWWTLLALMVGATLVFVVVLVVELVVVRPLEGPG